MSSETFDRLRIPIAIGVAVLLVAGYLMLRRTEVGSDGADASPSIVVGVPGGGLVTESASPSATPSVTPTPVVTASPVPTPTVAPTPVEPFVAEVMACRSISGASCIGEIERLRPDDDTFVALVLFDNAVAGDVMNVILDAASGPVEGGAYALQGSGRGFYYSTFVVSGLPEGDYTLRGIRNGETVARTQLRKTSRGGDDD
jgi:hypothetical protein